MLGVVSEAVDEFFGRPLSTADLVDATEDGEAVLDVELSHEEVELPRGEGALSTLTVQHFLFQLRDGLARLHEGFGDAAIPAAVAGGHEVRDAAGLEEGVPLDVCNRKEDSSEKCERTRK